MGSRYAAYARAACWGKTGYVTRSEALAAIELINKHARARARIISYRCRECHRWHIGNGKLPPDARIDSKRWKNWHWRKQTD